MLSSFQLLIALVLLGLGVLFYFISHKSPEKPQVGDDLDPLENVESEPPKPTKTTLVVADEPDRDLDPDVIVISTKPDSEDKPVKPTPTTTPAQPIIPISRPTVQPVNRRLTDAELNIFDDKVKKFYRPPRVPNECYGRFYRDYIINNIKPMEFDTQEITRILDSSRDYFASTQDPLRSDGFAPREC